ncbi:MAG: hypothetical protein NC210_03335 [[Clostridium] fimetarium]|nr:hypothetical protein [Alistipes timonensis]MCM1405436.1 hypothetical protein [[Clostridium] fimetarium]
MKFNKLYMALGVVALALASCSDDEEYTPAPAVVNPPAYFNISDTKEVDLEKNTTEISFPIYRADAGGAFNPNVAVEIISGDGVSPINCFTPLNSDTDPIFPEGATTGAIKYAVDMAQVAALVDYSFLFKLEGESTPYFITSNEFVVSYVPWVSMDDPATGALSTLVDDAIFQFLSIGGAQGFKLNLEVVVEKHPEKGIFRITHPYLNAPGALNSATSDGKGAGYMFDPNDPNYLYLNAENPDKVYFCEKNGSLGKVKWYDTGVCMNFDAQMEAYGNIKIYNGMYFTVNQENIDLDDGYYPYTLFENAYGTYTGETITFNNSEGLFVGLMNYKEALMNGKEWTLKLAGGSSLGWSSLGESTYSDGIIAQYWGEAVPTYQVATMENTSKPGVFRLQNPYRAGVYPYGSSSTDVAGEGPWNVVIDCTDPNFVIIEPTASGFSAGTEQYIANAAGYYTTTDDATKKMTKEQVIAAGLNDTYDAATRTITISHPMISGNAGSTWYSVWNDPNVPNFQPAVIVLPAEGQAAEASSYAAPKGKISLAKPRASYKVAR